MDVLLAEHKFDEVDKLVNEDKNAVLNQLMDPNTFQLAVASGYLKSKPSLVSDMVSANPKALGSICLAGPKVQNLLLDNILKDPSISKAD